MLICWCVRAVSETIPSRTQQSIEHSPMIALPPWVYQMLKQTDSICFCCKSSIDVVVVAETTGVDSVLMQNKNGDLQNLLITQTQKIEFRQATKIVNVSHQGSSTIIESRSGHSRVGAAKYAPMRQTSTGGVSAYAAVVLMGATCRIQQLCATWSGWLLSLSNLQEQYAPIIQIAPLIAP